MCMYVTIPVPESSTTVQESGIDYCMIGYIILVELMRYFSTNNSVCGFTPHLCLSSSLLLSISSFLSLLLSSIWSRALPGPRQYISHPDSPFISLSESIKYLEIGGLVQQPGNISAEKRRGRREVAAILCFSQKEPDVQESSCSPPLPTRGCHRARVGGHSDSRVRMSECRNQCGKGRQKIRVKKAERQQMSSLTSDQLTDRGEVVFLLHLYLRSLCTFRTVRRQTGDSVSGEVRL